MKNRLIQLNYCAVGGFVRTEIERCDEKFPVKLTLAALKKIQKAQRENWLFSSQLAIHYCCFFIEKNH